MDDYSNPPWDDPSFWVQEDEDSAAQFGVINPAAAIDGFNGHTSSVFQVYAPPGSSHCSNSPAHQLQSTAPSIAPSGLLYLEGNVDTITNGTASDQPCIPDSYPFYGPNWNTTLLTNVFDVNQPFISNPPVSSYPRTTVVSNGGPQAPQHHNWSGEAQQMVSTQYTSPYVQPCLEPVWTHDQLQPQTFDPCTSFSVSTVSTKAAQPHSEIQATTATKRPGRKCDYPGCPSITEFTRISDLQRHQKKHKSSPILCTAVGCDRRRKKPIHRQDKFREHILTNHGDTTLFTCPNSSCSIAPLPIGLLRLHFHLDCEGSFHKDKAKKSWSSLLDLEARACPFLGCRKIQPNIIKLEHHLRLKHNYQERIQQSFSLRRAGYDPETCGIICPICSEVALDAAEFSQHLCDVHTIIEKDHGLAWLNYVNTIIGRSGGGILAMKSILDSQYGFFISSGTYVLLNCPSCMFRAQVPKYGRFGRGWHQANAQHKGLFIKSPELYEHREAILRLLPGFGIHSIFEDIRPQEQKSGELDQGLLSPRS